MRCSNTRLAETPTRKGRDKAEAQTEAGIEHCAEQYQDLLKQGVAGVHFYVLNRTDVISSILNRVAT